MTLTASKRYPTLYRVLTDLDAYSTALHPERGLRGYQLAPARAILRSIEEGRGDQFAIVFSRQAGKDEMLAQLLSYLLVRSSQTGGTAVIGAPTFRPQALLTRDRLFERLRGNALTAPLTATGGTGTVVVGAARARFVSAARGANVRGLTADLLLVANEAQDIQARVWDAVFDPMAASTNATTVFMGTVWSSRTLLARQMRYLQSLEAQDGRQRVWRVPWDTVARSVPPYGARVRARIAQLGAQHPFIRTEYFLEELEGDGGLFPPRRIVQMQGDHPRLERARTGCRYALLIDVAGEEESGGTQVALTTRPDTRRDSTALTVVEVDTTSRPDGQATYRVVDRRIWTAVPHAVLHAQLVDLARSVWRASWVVVDATGIGAGLASFLRASLTGSRGGPPVEVIPFVFTAQSKSQLGWDFCGLIDAGRFREYRSDAARPSAAGQVTALYEAQRRATTFEVLEGPGRLLRWSVPAAAGHDDLVISAALVAVLDRLDMRSRIAVGS